MVSGHLHAGAASKLRCLYHFSKPCRLPRCLDVYFCIVLSIVKMEYIWFFLFILDLVSTTPSTKEPLGQCRDIGRYTPIPQLYKDKFWARINDEVNHRSHEPESGPGSLPSAQSSDLSERGGPEGSLQPEQIFEISSANSEPLFRCLYIATSLYMMLTCGQGDIQIMKYLTWSACLFKSRVEVMSRTAIIQGLEILACCTAYREAFVDGRFIVLPPFETFQIA